MKEVMTQKVKNVQAIGPYNLCIKANGFLFTSGMIGLDPETNELREGIVAQTEQVLVNLENLLADAGASLDNVVKSTVFVQSLNDFSTVNEIYSKHFTSDYPARSCVEVAKLPKGALVEIELIVAL